MKGKEQHPADTMKVVAKQLYNSSTRLYFAESDEDFEIMRKHPGGTFGCPEPGCGLPFKKPFRGGRRYHFAFMPGEKCGHLPARTSHGGGGGPMSSEHKWFQNRLLVICRHAGHEAIPEHRATDSDLYVPSSSYSIEVQRWPTNWQKRTKARIDKGAKVIWLITDSNDNRTDRDEALFNLPCVRVRVHALDDRERQPIQPWLNKADSRRARLAIWSTVVKYDHATEKLVSEGFVDAIKFFGEILDGQRSWHPRKTLQPLGIGYAAWVRNVDLNAALSAAQAKTEAEQAKLHADKQTDTTVPPKPEELRQRTEPKQEIYPAADNPVVSDAQLASKETPQTGGKPASLALGCAERAETKHRPRQPAPSPRIDSQQQARILLTQRVLQARRQADSEDLKRQRLRLIGRCAVGFAACLFVSLLMVKCSDQPNLPEPRTHTCATSPNDVFHRGACDQRWP